MSRIPSRLRDSKSHIWDSESHLRDSSAILFLESRRRDSESHIWDLESRRRDGIRDNPIYGILGFTVCARHIARATQLLLAYKEMLKRAIIYRVSIKFQQLS